MQCPGAVVGLWTLAPSFVPFASSSFCYSMTSCPHIVSAQICGHCGGRWKAQVSPQLSSHSSLVYDLSGILPLSVLRGGSRMLWILILYKSIIGLSCYVSGFFFGRGGLSVFLKKLLCYSQMACVLFREDSNEFNFVSFSDCQPLSNSRDQ